MKLLVCIKQVPATQQVEVDPETGVLKRDGVLSKINPYDLYALEAALTLRERLGGSITVLSMGPNQAEDALREALWMGADRGVLLSDRRFAGADVLATSYTLSQGIRALGGFDLILMGRQTTDGDTAQVGPAVAQWLGIPHAAWVSRIDEADASHLTVSQELARSVETVRMSYPCLITVEKDSFEPRLPSYRRRLAIGRGEIDVLGLDDLEDKNPEHYGLSGSPTQVERIFPPKAAGEKVLLEGADAGRALAELLIRRRVL